MRDSIEHLKILPPYQQECHVPTVLCYVQPS